MSGNIYQRQEELRDWNQSIVRQLKCLVLGIGGLGSTISMDLCRLGVAQICLVDMDTVDWHNLNRQILYRTEHIGRPKVECAVEELNRHHNNKTRLVPYNFNALEKWGDVVKMIKECDVVFNTIDHGDYFDYAVFTVARNNGKPVILGGTEPFYGHTISYFLQGIRTSDPTYQDCHDLENPTEVINVPELETVDMIDLPKDAHPTVGGSTVYSAGTCSHLMVDAVVNYMLHLSNSIRPDPPKHVIINLMTLEATRWFSTNVQL